jgi:hypothetical protein
MAVEFGIYTLTLSIYATVFIKHYNQTPTASSLHYIAIALGANTSLPRRRTPNRPHLRPPQSPLSQRKPLPQRSAFQCSL